ncbi:MAG: two-component sensor histidine kinase [Chthoniobacteraceae bacterium]|nr:two-component sensor histidine kinase [Chthoniobacteraceae bacterium]
MSFASLKRLARTVGLRIALWHSVIFIIGAALAFSAAYLLLQRSLDEQSLDAIEFRLNQFVSEYDRGGKQAVIALCKLRRGRAQKAFFVRLADSANSTLFLRDPEEWSEFQPQTLSNRPVEKELSWTELAGLEGSLLRIGTVRMEDGAILQIGKTLEGRQELLDRFRSALLLIAAIVIIVGVAGGASVAFRALRPVNQLTTIVNSILNTGKFTARVPARGTGDEIDELVECFNTMLGKIDQLIHGMRDSLDNVAHDLRTPMTRLRNIATKAVEKDYDKAACHEALGDCLEESERVLTMLTTLMDIAEAETGVMKLEQQPVNIAQLVGQIVDLYQHVAEEKEIEIVINVPTYLHLSGDAGRLMRALGNLLDNALKYTPEKGRVMLEAMRKSGEAGGLTIEVTDTGQGIPRDEIDRIWERLYRVDKSRSQRGLGLGLSFVKAIIEAHGGAVSVTSQAGRGSQFLVWLPG